MIFRLAVLIVFTLVCIAPVSIAHAEGINLISNPSLETGNVTPTSWFKGGWGTNTRLLQYPVAGIDGAKAARVVVSNFQSGDAKWYPADVAIVPGRTYVVRNFYLSTTTTYVSVRYLRTNGQYLYSSLGVATPSSAWRQFVGTTTAPSDAVSATIFHVLAGNGSLVTDAYEWREVGNVAPPPPPPPPQPTSTPSSNLVANSSFEIATDPIKPDSWQRGGWGTNNRSYIYPVPGKSGNAAQVSITTYTNGDVKWYFNPIAVTSGQEYEFQNAYRSSVQTEVTAQFQLANGSYVYSYLGKATASPADWATFSKRVVAPSGAVKVTVFHVLAGVGTLTVDDYLFTAVPTPVSQSYISLTFDDAYLSQYLKALPILEAAGIDATFYITTGRVGTQPERFMTWEQIADLSAKGHEIGGHTRTHPSLPSVTAEEQYAQIRGSYDDIVARGLMPYTFAYPFGDENQAVQGVVQQAGFLAARGVTLGYNDAQSNRYSLQDQHVEEGVTLDVLKGYIDTAIASKKWLILELHHQEDVTTNQYSNTPQLLQGIVDYIKEKGIPVVTMREGVRRTFGI